MHRLLSYTLEFLSKKNVKSDQGLDFLIFFWVNRGESQEKPQTNQEKIRNQENRGKTFKKPFKQVPYFIFSISLFKKRVYETVYSDVMSQCLSTDVFAYILAAAYALYMWVYVHRHARSSMKYWCI